MIVIVIVIVIAVERKRSNGAVPSKSETVDWVGPGNQHISRCSNWPQKRKMNICSNCAHKIAHYMSICFDTSLL